MRPETLSLLSIGPKVVPATPFESVEAPKRVLVLGGISVPSTWAFLSSRNALVETRYLSNLCTGKFRPSPMVKDLSGENTDSWDVIVMEFSDEELAKKLLPEAVRVTKELGKIMAPTSKPLPGLCAPAQAPDGSTVWTVRKAHLAK